MSKSDLAKRDPKGYLTQEDLVKLTMALLRDAEYIKTTKPTIHTMVDRYKGLIPGKLVTRTTLKRVLESTELIPFVTRPKGMGTPFAKVTTQRINAVAAVAKRLAEKLGEAAPEIDWDLSNQPELKKQE